ncbi:MAG TPA: Mur ligase domain-containing protein, partial [Acidobacteriaceae bacterium]|nr:Mur ligase domain-containing protein [Acidobacteriaceae bacterium]
MQGKKHIHLIGICGTAMASLAGLLQLKSHRVTGSDQAAYPPMSDLLRGLGITVAEPFTEHNLDPRPDLVIIGNAISRGNPEVETVLDQRIPFASLAQVIREEFISGRDSLVVAGTHGKTTTTSMLAWIYEVASRTDSALAPSFLIGGVAENFGTSFQLRDTAPLILEGDEYDTAFFDKGPKFMHYFPSALILTHVEFDHADIYRDLDSVKTAFKRLVNLVPRHGRIVAFDGAPNVEECVSRAFCAVERDEETSARDEIDEALERDFDSFEIGVDIGVIEFHVSENERVGEVVQKFRTFVEEGRVVLVAFNDEGARGSQLKAG